jgi:hypothetical protein
VESRDRTTSRATTRAATFFVVDAASKRDKGEKQNVGWVFLSFRQEEKICEEKKNRDIGENDYTCNNTAQQEAAQHQKPLFHCSAGKAKTRKTMRKPKKRKKAFLNQSSDNDFLKKEAPTSDRKRTNRNF